MTAFDSSALPLDSASLIREEELADRWDTSKNHIRRLRVRGDLPHVRIGRFVRFRPEDVQAYLDAHRRPAS